jgi:hypothetical protein
MALTTEQLDALCGGAPRYKLACPLSTCDKSFSYDSLPRAREALSGHLWAEHRRVLKTEDDD